jgi:hypothetical protein
MKVVVKHRTKKEQLQHLVNQYKEETGLIKFNMYDVATWAIHRGLWGRSPRSDIQLCAHELARAAGAEFYNDPQGRRVRKKHAVRLASGGKQLTLWSDITDAPPEHMKTSLQQRRSYIVGDCLQLKTDLDSYNENNNPSIEVQLSFNFSEDVAEREMPTKYPDKKPGKSGS